MLRAVHSLSFQLSGAQLGITLTSLVLGYVAEPALASLLMPAIGTVGLPAGVAHATAAAIALLIATISQMVFGELFPKNVAIATPLTVAERVVGPQMLFSRICRPAIVLLNGSANRLLRALGVEPQDELRSARSPSELGWLVRSSAEQGTLPGNTAALLRRSLRLRERTAQDVMTPRVHVVALHADDSVADLLRVAERSGHSRFPVLRRPTRRETLPHTAADTTGTNPDTTNPDTTNVDDVVAVVHVKDAFGVAPPARAATPVSQIMVPPVMVPSSLGCDDLLTTLRGHSLQLAIVIDEYGDIAGIVTLEDLVEELVGDVADEYDLPQTPDTAARADGSWALSGLLRLDEVTDRTGVALPDGPYETLAGLVLHRLGRIPHVGDTVTVAGHRLTVEKMDHRRIDRIRLTAAAEHPDPSPPVDPSTGGNERAV